MDVSFHLRAQRLLAERRPALLDHSMLLALLAAQRAGASAPAPEKRRGGADDPLVELVLAGPDWRRAACVQRGCFNRADSERRVNVP